MQLLAGHALGQRGDGAESSDLCQPFAQRFGLVAPDAGAAVRDLALQIGIVDLVVVAHGDPADSRGAQIETGRRPQSAGTDYQRMTVLQPLLAFDTDFVQQDVAAEAQ